jgi:hypothetical protein
MQIAASNLAARPRPGIAADCWPTATTGVLCLTPNLRRAIDPASDATSLVQTDPRMRFVETAVTRSPV